MKYNGIKIAINRDNNIKLTFVAKEMAEKFGDCSFQLEIVI